MHYYFGLFSESNVKTPYKWLRNKHTYTCNHTARQSLELLEDIQLCQSRRGLVQKTEKSNLDLQPNNALAADQYIPEEQQKHTTYCIHNMFMQLTNYIPAFYG